METSSNLVYHTHKILSEAFTSNPICNEEGGQRKISLLAFFFQELALKLSYEQPNTDPQLRHLKQAPFRTISDPQSAQTGASAMF